LVLLVTEAFGNRLLRFALIVVSSYVSLSVSHRFVSWRMRRYSERKAAESCAQDGPAGGASDRWLVLLDGQPVAMIDNPQDADMFWFTWDVHGIDGAPVPADLWDYSNDGRRSFQHADTGEIDAGAFPAGNRVLASGRICIRGPLRDC
jgi:hypothetical protein